MPSGRAHGGSGTHLADCLGRPISQYAALGFRLHHGGAGPQSSDLEDGQTHHHRLGDLNEQGLRGYRSMQIISHAGDESGSSGASTIDNSLDGGVRGWQYTCSVFSDRYAAADSVRANISRADSVGYALSGG